MSDDVSFTPGEGPTSGISVTLSKGTLEAIRARVGKRGVSAYLEAAAQRQIEQDNLAELVAEYERTNGPLDPAAVAEKVAILDALGRQHGAA